jgi:hypothetical protein
MNYRQFLLTSSIALGLGVGGMAVAADDPTSQADVKESSPAATDVNPSSATTNTDQPTGSSESPAQPGS